MPVSWPSAWPHEREAGSEGLPRRHSRRGTQGNRLRRGLTFEVFEGDERTAFAVVRALEIMGEAVKSVPTSIREQAPDVPWHDIAGMRDKLIHAYHGVDLRVVWRTVKEELPRVAAEVGDLLETLDDQG